MLSRKTFAEAPMLWRQLNGVINVYKPAGVSMRKVKHTIMSNLCRDLNELEVRPQREIVKIEADPSSEKFLVTQQKDLADNVLVVGERYQLSDIRSSTSCALGKFSCGVLGVNGGTRNAFKIRDNRPIRVYHITGLLGRSTETHFNDSAVTLRASFDHVTLNQMSSFLASLESSHQKKMFELCGVDIQTQAAYELAIQGPLRPSVSNIPLVYSMRCIEFKKPFFTIEVHAVNESEAYLGILIHEIGIHLKSVAHCTQVRCIRQAHFTLEDALVRRHWNLTTILGNIRRNQELIYKHPEMLKQLEATLNTPEEDEQ